MSVTELERRHFGEPVPSPVRAIAGAIAVVGLAGHAALAGAALTFLAEALPTLL